MTPLCGKKVSSYRFGHEGQNLPACWETHAKQHFEEQVGQTSCGSPKDFVSKDGEHQPKIDSMSVAWGRNPLSSQPSAMQDQRLVSSGLPSS